MHYKSITKLLKSCYHQSHSGKNLAKAFAGVLNEFGISDMVCD